MANIEIRECSNVNLLTELFKSHKSDPFAPLESLFLFKILTPLKICKIFVAFVNEVVIGCLCAMQYMYRYGWLGGLLVHKEHRRKGIGSRLIDAALAYLNFSPVFLFVKPDNSVAQMLYEKAGFRVVYRRINYTYQKSIVENTQIEHDLTYDVKWEDLINATGMSERGQIVNLGYYPIKLTKQIFRKLNQEKNVVRFGGVIAILEECHEVDSEGNTFLFNDYILRNVSVPKGKKMVEVNPFYINPEENDFWGLLNHLLPESEIVVRTYQGDPIIDHLPSGGTLAALLMEYGE